MTVSAVRKLCPCSFHFGEKNLMLTFVSHDICNSAISLAYRNPCKPAWNVVPVCQTQLLSPAKMEGGSGSGNETSWDGESAWGGTTSTTGHACGHGMLLVWLASLSQVNARRRGRGGTVQRHYRLVNTLSTNQMRLPGIPGISIH